VTEESDFSRRNFLVGAAGAALALATKTGAAVPSDVPSLTMADIDRMMKELSNWRRWGKDDARGTVNLITAAKRRQALALARDANVISLSHAVSAEKFADNDQPLGHVMNSTGEGAPGSGAGMDTYTMRYHGGYYTHMDALCHMFYKGQAYNGNPQQIVTHTGASKLDVTAFQEGIVTRGVLMDIPRLKGVRYLEPGAAIYPEDLDAWEKQAKLKVASGDMVLIRTGRWARRAEVGAWPVVNSAAGLFASCAGWLKQRDVGVLASDAISDVKPSRVEGLSDPIHKVVIVALGTPIFDNCDLEQVSETANRLQRWEFLVTAAPMVVPGGTGSPVNPLAIF
jgi:kynurenine formamidase